MVAVPAVGGLLVPPNCPSFSVAEIPTVDPNTNKAGGKFRFAVENPRRDTFLRLFFNRAPFPTDLRLDREEVVYHPTRTELAALSFGGVVEGIVIYPPECATGPVLLGLIKSPIAPTGFPLIFLPPIERVRRMAAPVMARLINLAPPTSGMAPLTGLLGLGLLPTQELPLVSTLRQRGLCFNVLFQECAANQSGGGRAGLLFQPTCGPQSIEPVAMSPRYQELRGGCGCVRPVAGI